MKTLNLKIDFESKGVIIETPGGEKLLLPAVDAALASAALKGMTGNLGADYRDGLISIQVNCEVLP